MYQVYPEGRGHMDGVDGWRAALPSVAAYVDQLPRGLASYPECVVSGELVDRLAVSGWFEHERDLPPELTALLAAGATRAAWVPEALYVALVLALGDGAGPDANDDAGADPGLVGPVLTRIDDLIRAGHTAFARDHRGTSETQLHHGPGWSASAFSYPTLVIPPTLLDQMARRALAALRHANVSEANVEFRTEPDSRALGRSLAVFTTRWNAVMASASSEAADWRLTRDRLVTARGAADRVSRYGARGRPIRAGAILRFHRVAVHPSAADDTRSIRARSTSSSTSSATRTTTRSRASSPARKPIGTPSTGRRAASPSSTSITRRRSRIARTIVSRTVSASGSNTE